MASFGLAMLIFGYLAASCAVIGLMIWGLLAMLPPLREAYPELVAPLGRLGAQWLGIGVISFLIGVTTLPPFGP